MTANFKADVDLGGKLIKNSGTPVDDTDLATKGYVDSNGGGGGGAVTSVNSKTGAVVLTASDVSAVPTTRTVNSKALSANVTLTQDDIGDGTTAKQYTATEKTKLGTIASGAEVNVNADWNSASGDSQILNKPTIPSSTPTYLGTLTGHATSGYVLSTDGAGTYTFVAQSGGGGAVSSVNTKTGAVVLTQDDIADGTTAKQYTATEKTKLSGIATGAEVNVNADWNSASGDSQILNKPTLGTAAASATTDFATAAQGTKADNAVPNTRTVAGHALSANVTLVKGDVGLGNVDNTSDVNKPVSTAQQTALDAKLDDSQFLNGLTAVWIGTQAQYNAIGSPISTVIYATTP